MEGTNNSPPDKNAKLEELAFRRESKELSPQNFDVNFIDYLAQNDLPLTRKDLLMEGPHAAVITRDEMEILGGIDLIHASGKRMFIEPESLNADDVLILYPEDLGDEEGVSLR